MSIYGLAYVESCTSKSNISSSSSRCLGVGRSLRFRTSHSPTVFYPSRDRFNRDF